MINAILEKGHIPSGMELWAAGNRPPLERVEEYLRRCDAHILLLGARYGSLLAGPGKPMSFTEWEFRQSDGVRPILAFVYDGQSLAGSRRIERDPHEKSRETVANVDRLRRELLASRYVKEFSKNGLSELQKNAILALDELQQSGEVREDAGWMRADSPEAQIVRDVVSNRFLKRELEQLQKFNKLGQRVNLDVGSKEAMARLFWRNMQGRLRRNGFFHLFFESGSTMAYLADEFEKTALAADEGKHQWQIRTNNVLSAVQFDLHTPIDASRFPPGVPDPDDPYGAIFPNEWRQLQEPPPKKPRVLSKGEVTAVGTMRATFYKQYGSHQLVLAAASGLDLDNGYEDFRGPHVASHPNMLFKRALFTSGSPVVLFINAEKLGDPFNIGRCYPVCDANETWPEVIKRFPLAICVGYEWPDKLSNTASRIPRKAIRQRNNPATIRETLNRLGFTVEYFSGDLVPAASAETSGTGAMMLGNRRFATRLPNDWDLGLGSRRPG